MDRFSDLKVIGDYIHLLKRDSALRITLPIRELLPDYAEAIYGLPRLSRDGLYIEFDNSVPNTSTILISDLIPDEQNRLGLSSPKLVSSSELSGIHPVYLEIRNEVDSDYVIKSPPLLDSEALLILTLNDPVLIHQYGGKTYCFGNVAAYKAALLNGSDTKIWARLYTKKSAKSFFRSLVITDIYTRALLNQGASKSASHLYQLQNHFCRSASYAEEFKKLHPVARSKAEFARIHGVDPRSIK